VSIQDLVPVLRKWGLDPGRESLGAAEIEVKYEGYIREQSRTAARLRSVSSRRIPHDFDYTAVPGLSHEVKEKLSKVRPRDLGMAGRIPGVTPAAISILNIHLGRHRVPTVDKQRSPGW
jgi:tRNA uridine 5-carboxymethylaminomethyl modification enzyme